MVCMQRLWELLIGRLLDLLVLEMGEGVLHIRGCGNIGEHLSTWRPNVFRCQRFSNRNFWRCDAGILRFFAKDGVEFGEEHGEDRGWNVEGWREDDADVTDAHLVDFGVVNYADQEGGKSADKSPIWLRKSMHKKVV